MAFDRTQSAPLKPPPLRAGDTIGIVAPASNIERDALEAGCAALESLGYQPFYLPSILERDLYFAGSVERRVRELEEMFQRPEVRAILCARGGYGCNYLLGRLSLEVVQANPKPFIGYSDLTSLLTWFTDYAGLVTFHGPMLAKDFAETEGVDQDTFEYALNSSAGWEIPADELETLAYGEGEGVLTGGCLSILVSSLGTPYEFVSDERILFLEDVAAKPYQIDRMLMQLRLAGKLDNVRGIVFGEMLNCVQGPQQDYTLQEVIRRALAGLRIPIAYGLRSGHVSRRNVTLPFGVRARLTVDGNVRLHILESATSVSAGSARP